MAGGGWFGEKEARDSVVSDRRSKSVSVSVSALVPEWSREACGMYT
jgi:hypothetical protein